MTSRVVVIDDDRSWTDTLAGLLTDRGLSVCMAHDGVEGYQIIEATRPSLIILDLNLPRMSGIQLLARLRQSGWSIPVVVISGEDDPDVKMKVATAGANAFLAKPASLADLLNALRRFLPGFERSNGRQHAAVRRASVAAISAQAVTNPKTRHTKHLHRVGLAREATRTVGYGCASTGHQ
jgi:DNA-binding response OmpR family regulator